MRPEPLRHVRALSVEGEQRIVAYPPEGYETGGEWIDARECDLVELREVA